MTRDDVGPFTAELARLAELYDKPISVALGALYFEALQSYPITEVVSAMRRHVIQSERGRFFPKPADLVVLLDGDAESRALQAWTTAVRAWEQYGVYRSVEFADQHIAATVEDMGGWIAFDERYCLAKEEPFMRKEFVTRYLGYLQSPPRRVVGVLHGIHQDITRAPVAIGEGVLARERKALTE